MAEKKYEPSCGGIYGDANPPGYGAGSENAPSYADMQQARQGIDARVDDARIRGSLRYRVRRLLYDVLPAPIVRRMLKVQQRL